MLHYHHSYIIGCREITEAKTQLRRGGLLTLKWFSGRAEICANLSGYQIKAQFYAMTSRNNWNEHNKKNFLWAFGILLDNKPGWFFFFFLISTLMFNWTFVCLSTQVSLFKQDIFVPFHILKCSCFRKIPFILKLVVPVCKCNSMKRLTKSNDDHHKYHAWISPNITWINVDCQHLEILISEGEIHSAYT